MKFSQFFNLGVAQPALDFVDIELEQDQPLFIDPYALQVRPDAWSSKCTQAIGEYFNAVLDAVRSSDDVEAMTLLSSLHEPSETRLGLSVGHSKGNAIGGHLARQLLAALKASRAVQTGLLSDLSDAQLFVPNIGHDRVSDLATNVVRNELIQYTQEQCRLYGVEMRQAVNSGPLWDAAEREWTSDLVPLPVADGQKILLVPKLAVRWRPILTPREFYDQYALDYLQAEESNLPLEEFGRAFRRSRRVLTKKELRERFPFSKEWLTDFSLRHPEVLEEYKAAKAAAATPEFGLLADDFDERIFATVLSNELQRIAPGNEAATRYHRFMAGVLEFLFYPQLSNPVVEHEINEGRKRIDIRFSNSAREGFFNLFPQRTRLPLAGVAVECKNYSRELGNPEVDQLAMRFAPHRGYLGILLCRSIENRPLMLARCRDVVRNRQGYPLVFDDTDVLTMLSFVANDRRASIDAHLERQFIELTR